MLDEDDLAVGLRHPRHLAQRGFGIGHGAEHKAGGDRVEGGVRQGGEVLGVHLPQGNRERAGVSESRRFREHAGGDIDAGIRLDRGVRGLEAVERLAGPDADLKDVAFQHAGQPVAHGAKHGVLAASFLRVPRGRMLVIDTGDALKVVRRPVQQDPSNAVHRVPSPAAARCV